MGIFTKKSRESRESREVSPGPTAVSIDPIDGNKSASATDDAVPNDSEQESSSQDNAVPTEDAQAGVREVEGVTLSWSKKSLVAVFIKYVTFTVTSIYLLARLLDLLMYWKSSQHMAVILCQRFSVRHSVQLAPVRDERLRVAFSPKCHLRGCRMHVGSDVHSSVENTRRLWPCRGIPAHERLRYTRPYYHGGQ